MRALLPLAVALVALLLFLWRIGAFLSGDPPQTRVDLALPPPPQPLRILALGTSLTQRGDWTEVLGERLTACRGAPVVVTKLALSGASSRWGEPALERELKIGPVPDLVLIEFAVNDAHLGRLVSPAESRRRHTAMIEAAQRAGASVALLTMTKVHGLEAAQRPFLAVYRSQYGLLAETTGASVIDTLPPWKQLSEEMLRAYVPDGSHPTAEAMRTLLVPALLSALKPAICPAGADPTR
jgi:acyl-CoA thioesterase-1